MRTGILMLAAGIALAQTPRGGVESPPDFPPSYQVHISPTGTNQPGTSVDVQGNYWISRGFDMKSIVAEVCDVDRSRVELAGPVDNDKRYDYVMVLPGPESKESIHSYVRKAIQDEFHVSITPESEPKDVYVVTAPNGLGQAAKMLPRMDWNVIGSGMTIADDSISGKMIDMSQLCRMLEHMLGRLLVDETRITDRFDVEAKGSGRGREALLAMLRDQLGLVLTPERRNVDMIVVRAQ